MRHQVVRLPVYDHLAVGRQLDAVVGIGQVLGHDPPVHAAVGHALQDRLGHERLRGGEHARLQLAEQLDVAHGIGKVRPFEVEIIDRHRLLENGRIAAQGIDGHQRRIVVHHVIASQQPRRIRQPVGMLVVGRTHEQQRRVDRTARHDKAVGIDDDPLAAALQFYPDHAPPRVVREQPVGERIRPQRDRRALQRRSHAVDVALALGQHLARKAVARLAADTAPAIAQVDTHGVVEGMQPLLEQSLAQILDVGLVRHFGKGERSGARRLGRIFAGRAVHGVDFLGTGIVWLQFVVRDGPGR